jgi:signal transduction histidine kinase
VKEQHPFESELIARIGWLIRLRWLAVSGMAFAIVLSALLFPDLLTWPPLLGVTTAIGLYNLVFFLDLRTLRSGRSGTMRLGHATRSAYLQIILDLTALAVLLHFAGGAENPMAFFFVFHMIIASTLLSQKVSYFMAGLASLLFVAVAALEYTGILGHYHIPISSVELYREPLYLLISTVAVTLALFMVTYLATSISVQLRARDRELLASNLTCQLRSSELEKLNQQLQQIDQERTRFIVLVTHELRAPINTIYSALDLALSGYATLEKSREMLARAQRRATELLQLISDLLDLARAREQAGQPMQESPLQLADVLRDVVDFVQVEADEKGLVLQVDIGANLAPVQMLPDQAKLIWTNLLSNAIRYTKAGGSIQISLSQDEVQVIGMVRDTGIGIAAADLPHVFDEFFRAENARSVSPHGTGVGLAVVRRIIENGRGKIWVESNPGAGSTFTFVLPKATTEAASIQVTGQRGEQLASAQPPVPAEENGIDRRAKAPGRVASLLDDELDLSD